MSPEKSRPVLDELLPLSYLSHDRPGYADSTHQPDPAKLVIDMRVIPHFEATESDVLRDTIRHHEVLIGEMMEAAAIRHSELHRTATSSIEPPCPLDPAQVEDLSYRFLLVLAVACELDSRPPADAG